jgi:UDP-N-acetylglucosamine--N-acetylmuramyl-(pentapeptide) pyrophosphoryl-undecaprenol N-acetylglucosamine transferase
VSRWAVYHATGMPPEYYQYPKDKMKYVGVIVSEAYQQVTPSLMEKYRQQIDLPKDAQVLLVTGGSSGARSINKAVVALAPQLFEQLPKLHILHVVGRGNEGIYNGYEHARLFVADLLKDFYIYTGAADVIVTRAGANTIAEFGIQAKACIVVPNPLLTGGHQLKNADYLLENKAAVIVGDAVLSSNPEVLKHAISDLFNHANKRQELGHHLHELTVADAADSLAKLLFSVGKRAGE